MIRPRRLLVLAAAFLLAATPIKAPSTARHPVTDAYSGATVTDEYRWLENAADPAVTRWVEEQNRYSRSILDAVPNRSAIEQRIRALIVPPRPHRPLAKRSG